MSLDYVRGSADPDATLYRQLEQYVLDHCPNPTRSDCLTSEVLKSLVYEPEILNLQDPQYQHIMECAECLREVIGFREARQAQASLHAQHLSRSGRTFNILLLCATAAACIVVGIVLGTHWKKISVPSQIAFLLRSSTSARTAI